MTSFVLPQGSWPQNGLDLAILGLPSLWSWMKSIVRDFFFIVVSSQWSQNEWDLNEYLFLVSLKDDGDGANELQSLKSLVSNLRQLLDLHQKYNCRLSLSVFEKVCLLLEIFSLLAYYHHHHIFDGGHIWLTTRSSLNLIEVFSRSG